MPIEKMSPEEVTRVLIVLNQLSRTAVTLGRIGKANGLHGSHSKREGDLAERKKTSGALAT